MSTFSTRHIGPSESEKTQMLNKIGVSSVEELIEKTIPAPIRLNRELNIADAMSEQEYLQHIAELGKQNQVFR